MGWDNPPKTKPKTAIRSFTGEYRWLSNFYGVEVEMDGMIYTSTEHAYQAAKTFNVEMRRTIRLATTPGQAKKLGRRVDLRPDWESVKLLIMENLLRQKFSNPGLRQKLVDTGISTLVEGNTWGDTFWGQVNGVGKNHLGRLLMKIRSEDPEWVIKHGQPESE